MGKKEKKRGTAEIDLEPDEHVDVKRKKKKRKKHKHEQSPENININECKDEHFVPEVHVTSRSAGGVKKKKKDRQGGLSETDVEATEEKMLEGTNGVQLETVKEKRRKKKGKVDATPISDEQESKVEQEDKEATWEIEKVNKKKKKRKQRDHDIVIENKYVFDDSDSPKEKRSKTDHEIGSSLTSVDEVVDLDTNQRKAMKKKKRKHRDDCSEKIDSQEAMHPGVEETESHAEHEKHIKKVKKRKEHKDHGLETDGDACEKRSGKDACDHLNGKKSDKTTTVVGQWGTAQFDSSERQNKFFRLLGGMKSQGTGVVAGATTQGKKSLFGGLAALTTKTGKSAMTNEQQTEWQTKMESQFDKALTYKVQKGGGLGFEKPPEEVKKFHINIHKSNSIKFDD